MQATKALRLGLASLCLMCSLSACGTLRGLLSAPPAPPAAQVCPSLPDALTAPVAVPAVCPSLPSALTAPVSVPDVCTRVTDGESLLDCVEAALPALQACNSQLMTIKSKVKE